MTDQSSNYDRAVDNLNEAQEGTPALMAERLVTAQSYALLAVADELRALRELLAEKLTRPAPPWVMNATVTGVPNDDDLRAILQARETSK
jgi:hypothetical protein